MTNRLDDKIRAFVLELVDDPPPAPEIDLEAAEASDPCDRIHAIFRYPGACGRFKHLLHRRRVR